MAITVVDSGTTSNVNTAGNTAVAVNFTGLAFGDVVYVSGRDVQSMPADWSAIAAPKTYFRAWRKVMGVVPDTTATVTASATVGSSCSITYLALRGVDPFVPEDGVTITTGTSAVGNGPAITPATTGAVISIASVDTNDTASTAPSGYTNLQSIGSTGSAFSNGAAIAIKIGTTGGVSEDPGAFGSFSSTGGDCMTIAVRAGVGPFSSTGTVVGGANASASATTIPFSPTANTAVGDLLVVISKCDRTGVTTATGTTFASAADSKGNSWTLVGEYTFDATPNTDLTVSAFICRVTTPILTSDTITVTFGGSVANRVADAVSWGTSGPVQVYGAVQYDAAASSDPGSLTVSGLSTPTGNYLAIRAMGTNTGSTGLTGTAGWSQVTPTSTAVNRVVDLEYLLSTATSFTSNPTGPAAVAHADVMFVLGLGAPAAALAATPAAQASITAALTTQIKLAATPAAVATATAALTAQIKLAASPGAQASMTAALTAPSGFASALAVVATVAGSLTTQIKLGSAPAARAAITAALTNGIRLAAAGSAQASMTANLTDFYDPTRMLAAFS